MSEERTPGRAPTVDDEEIVAVLDGTVDPVLTTAEIAAALPIGRRATLERLKALRERGAVESKRVGSRGLVWWRSEEGDGSGSSEVDAPFLTGPTYASGRADVSGSTDEALVEAATEEADPDG